MTRFPPFFFNSQEIFQKLTWSFHLSEFSNRRYFRRCFRKFRLSKSSIYVGTVRGLSACVSTNPKGPCHKRDILSVFPCGRIQCEVRGWTWSWRLFRSADKALTGPWRPSGLIWCVCKNENDQLSGLCWISHEKENAYRSRCPFLEKTLKQMSHLAGLKICRPRCTCSMCRFKVHFFDKILQQWGQTTPSILWFFLTCSIISSGVVTISQTGHLFSLDSSSANRARGSFLLSVLITSPSSFILFLKMRRITITSKIYCRSLSTLL